MDSKVLMTFLLKPLIGAMLLFHTTAGWAGVRTEWEVQVNDENFGRGGTIINSVMIVSEACPLQIPLHPKDSPTTTVKMSMEISRNAGDQIIAELLLNASALNGFPQIAPAFFTRYLLNQGQEIEVQLETGAPSVSQVRPTPYSIFMKVRRVSECDGAACCAS